MPPVKRLFGYLLILAIIANLPVVSGVHAGAAHSHSEEATHHHGYDAASTSHLHGQHAAMLAEESSLNKASAANRRSPAQNHDQPCCTLVGGMCVTLISEAPHLPGNESHGDYDDAALAAVVEVLGGISPPPPKRLS